MAIITFKSNETKETGQTMSVAAVASQMAIEHNYKILIISTSFKDKSLENCFWEVENKKTVEGENKKAAVGVEAGLEGLMRVLASNRTSPEIIKNYSKIILRDRLDVLPSTNATDIKDYENVAASYVDIIQLANRHYDMIFIDLSKNLPKEYYDQILQISDIVVVSVTQNLKSINDFFELKERDEFYRKRNIMLLIGRYDSFSKYNVKNITRQLREKKEIGAIPYNTLLFEACSEGKIIDFFLKLKGVEAIDRNNVFVKTTNDFVNSLIYKLQELQMKY